MNAEKGQIEGGCKGEKWDRRRERRLWLGCKRKKDRREGRRKRERASGSVQVFAEPPRAW